MRGGGDRRVALAYPDEVPPPTPGEDRQPVLIWTPTVQATFDQMRTEAETNQSTLGATWFNTVITNANAGPSSVNSGLWAALAYRMTGAAVYVQLALDAMTVFLNSTNYGPNDIREYFEEHVLMFDWLYSGMTQTQRDQHFTKLDQYALKSVTLPNGQPPTFPVSVGDSDQLTGTYFGLAFYHLAFGSIHPYATTLFNAAYVGGLASTGSNQLTFRNTVRTYIERAAGGEWIEGGEYNSGTTQLLFMGVLGIYTATGIDYFPEYTTWKQSAARRNYYMHTPDLMMRYQWGDDQKPHTLKAYAAISNAMMQDDPHSRKFVYDMTAKHGTSGSSVEPLAKGFLGWNPYGAQLPKTTLGTVFDTTAGQGIVTDRTSWNDTASSLFVHFPRSTWPFGAVNHNVSYHGDVQLYRNQQFALTHPITYGGPSCVRGEGCNTGEVCGFGGVPEYRGNHKVYTGTGWTYVAATQGGSLNGTPYYFPPPTFLHEWSRMVLWIQGSLTTPDTIVTCDRINTLNPQLLINYDRHMAANRTRIQANPLRQWYWHCPVSPTMAAQSATWAIGSETARVTWVRTDLVPTIVNQTTAWTTANGYNVATAEKKFHVKLVPSPDPTGFDVTVQVFEAGNVAQFGTITAIDNGDTKGVKIVRSGQQDIVVLFNAIAGGTLADQTGSAGVYNAGNPALLNAMRPRSTAVSYVPAANSRIWWPETASGVLYQETAGSAAGWMTITFTWGAVSGAESYQLEIGTTSGGTQYAVTNVGNVLSYQVALPPGTYYSRVRAVIGGVPGTASTEQIFYV